MICLRLFIAHLARNWNGPRSHTLTQQAPFPGAAERDAQSYSHVFGVWRWDALSGVDSAPLVSQRWHGPPPAV